MSSLPRTAIAALFGMMGCIGSDEPATSDNELGLRLTQFDDDHVEGRLVTQLGDISFRGDRLDADKFRYEFDRGRGAFGSTSDLKTLTSEFHFPDGYAISEDDRFILDALALTVEAELGNTSPIIDNLFRHASLWGAHPVERVRFKRVQTVDPERGYTRLCTNACNSTPPWRTFYHSGKGCDGGYTCGTSCNHYNTTYGHYLPYGKNAPNCRARCGAGCGSIGTSVYTAECGNHDVCEQRHTNYCGDEMDRAWDGFLYAANCAC